MKMKWLAATLISFLASSLAFAEPALQAADDVGATDATAQVENAPQGNIGAMSMNNNSPASMDGSSAMSTNNANDDMSADTATGDDDY